MRAVSARHPILRGALWPLVLGAPLILGARALLGPRVPEPLPVPPGHAHLVVVTFGSWPDPDLWPSGPAFSALARRGARTGTVWATTDYAPGAAASLWTGRWAPHHGVLAEGRRLAPGTWNVATAHRAAGARTAAYLGAPWIHFTGLEGFDDVVQEAGIGPERLGALAAEFLAREPERMALLWLHLEDPGSNAREAERLLAAVQRALDASGRRPDAFLVVTALAGRRDLADEGALLVPFAAELPGAYSAGSLGQACISHVELAGLLQRYMRLANPSLAAGQVAPQSRLQPIWGALRGGRAWAWIWLEGSFGQILRQQHLRAHLPPGSDEPRLSLLRAPRELDAHGELPPEALEGARGAFLSRLHEVSAGAPPALDSPPAPR